MIERKIRIILVNDLLELRIHRRLPKGQELYLEAVSTVTR
jgi:hypothetical protein